MENINEQINKVIKKHNKIVEKIENLNNEAFELEKELMYLRTKK